MAFQVHSLYEAVLHNARFKLFKNAQNSSLSFVQGLQELSPATQQNRTPVQGNQSNKYITQFIIKPFFLTVYEKEISFMSVEAQSGTVQDKDHNVRFSQIIFKNLNDHRQIITETAFWDDHQKKFLIPGSYLAKTPKGQAQGKGISIGLDFSLAAL